MLEFPQHKNNPPPEIFDILDSLYTLVIMESDKDVISNHLGLLLDNIIGTYIVDYPLSDTVPFSIFASLQNNQNDHQDVSDDGDDGNIWHSRNIYTFCLLNIRQEFLGGGEDDDDGRTTLDLKYLPYYIIFGLARFNNDSPNHQVPFCDHIDKMDTIASYYNKYIPSTFMHRLKTRREYLLFRSLPYFKDYPLYLI